MLIKQQGKTEMWSLCLLKLKKLRSEWTEKQRPMNTLQETFSLEPGYSMSKTILRAKTARF